MTTALQPRIHAFIQTHLSQINTGDAHVTTVVLPHNTGTSKAEQERRLYASPVLKGLPKLAASLASESEAQVTAMSLLKLGRLIGDMGKLQDAECLFARAVQLRAQWLFESSPMARIVELTVPLDELGRMAELRGEIDLAQAVYTLMHDLIAEAIQAEPEQRAFFIGLAQALQRLASLARSIGDTQTSERLLAEATEAMSKVPLAPTRERPIDTQLLTRGAASIASGLQGAARALEDKGDFSQARLLTQLRIDSMRKAATEPVVATPLEAERGLAISLCDLSRESRLMGDWTGSLKADSEALGRFEELITRVPSDVTLRLMKAIVLCGQGQAHFGLGELEPALAKHDAALTLALEVAQQATDLQAAQRHVGVVLSHQGKLFERMGNVERAAEAVRESLAIAERQHLQDPRRADRRVDVCCNLSRALTVFPEPEREGIRSQLAEQLDFLAKTGMDNHILKSIRASTNTIESVVDAMS